MATSNNENTIVELACITSSDTLLFKEYLNNNGAEKAKGYLDAIAVFTNQIEELFSTHSQGHVFESTPSRVRTRLKQFQKEKEEFILLSKSIKLECDNSLEKKIPTNQ